MRATDLPKGSAREERLAALRKAERRERLAIFGCLAAMVGALFAAVGTWGTAIINDCLHSHWVLLVMDLFVFPVGIVHGVGIWFGVW